MAVTLGGDRTDVAGNFPKVGDTAPDFKLVNKDLADPSGAKRRRVLTSVS